MKTFEVGGTTLSLALFVDVTNSKDLLDLMQAGTLEPEVAFLNASLIPAVFPVLAAAHKTLVAKSRASLMTRTLHSELVYNYSGSKHISESLKRCGISDSTSYILVARFGASAHEITVIKGLIKGAEIGLEELEARYDQALILKHYKISTLELGISSVSDAVACRIAARDALRQIKMPVRTALIYRASRGWVGLARENMRLRIWWTSLAYIITVLVNWLQAHEIWTNELGS